MSNFIDEAVKTVFEDSMSKLREDIGREVTLVYAPTTIDCPNCGWDPVKQKSNGRYSPTDPYPSGTVSGPIDFNASGILICPICNGAGRVETAEVMKKVVCLISPLSRDEAEKTPLGKDYKFNFELATEYSHYTDFETAKSLIVNNHPTEVVGLEEGGIGDITQLIVYAGGGR